MRIALYGGAFDPIHRAHLAIARVAVELYSLDCLLIIPAANPPHKRLHAPYEDRYRMVELAVEGEPHLEASRLESGTEHSYSIDTIEAVRRHLPEQTTLLFVIGADAFAEIESWKRWRDVIQSVEFIVVSRPGHQYRVPEGARAHRLDGMHFDVSSSAIRDQLAKGAPAPDLPEAVMRYIEARGLYRALNSQAGQ